MNRVTALAKREIGDWRGSFAVAAIVGLFPVFSVWLPDVSANTRAPIAILLTVLATIVLAPAVGVSLFGRDFRERRLGFYFARPLRSAAIWAGKVTGGLAIVLGCQGLLLAPTALVDASLFDGLHKLPAALAVTLFLLSLGVVQGLWSRSRLAALNGLLVVGLALIIVALALRHQASGFVMGHSRSSWVPFPGVGAFLAALVLLLASSVALARGRADAAAVQRILAIVLWPPLYLLAALWLLVPGLLMRSSPERLESIKGAFALQGNWVIYSGREKARPYQPQFLHDLASGRWRQLLPTAHGWLTLEHRISANGKRLVTVEAQLPLGFARLGSIGYRQGFRALRVVVMDLDGDGSAPRHIPIGPVDQTGRRHLRISADGLRAAIVFEKNLWIGDLAAAVTLAEGDLPAEWSRPGAHGAAFAFHESGRLRAVRAVSQDRGADAPVQLLELWDIAPTSGHARKMGEIATPDVGGGGLEISRGIDRILVSTSWAEGLWTLNDGRTGTRLAELRFPRKARPAFLPDGRIVVFP